ncbi:hypothetical protein B0T26DRAFT_720144 [Lasiosphaeria miniovina]|uniref:Uncharacterized protein n=1 Tax=Lasiosphaeria miniovina TaxID=1954250 RepID=A0AA40A494_9PEZI|nr:uncharacterized protein B0T26DRAFT_720144 [Lasiosphaeria miniovina]KAK0709013.1 hypothetical protein B0T26DRAFT_720144 [Lasiosphaeria miniovina]
MKDGEGEEKMQSPGLLIAQAALARSMSSQAGMRTRDVYGRGGMGRPGPDPLEKDIYDDLDKGLENVQSTCEHAAHEVLKYGDCAEEVDQISRRMTENMALTKGELERVEREDPEALKAAEDESRGRTYRPPSMRKDLSHRNDIKHGTLTAVKASASASSNDIVAGNQLTADDGMDDREGAEACS